MRPRGLSFSFDVSTYVGQLAVQRPQWTHSWKFRYSIFRLSHSRSIPTSVRFSSVADAMSRLYLRETGDAHQSRSDLAHEPPRVPRTVRVERPLDLGGEAPVRTRFAPDVQSFLPSRRAAGDDHVP